MSRDQAQVLLAEVDQGASSPSNERWEEVLSSPRTGRC